MKVRTVSWLGLVIFLAGPLDAADSSGPVGGTSGSVAQATNAPAPSPPALSPYAAQVVKLSSAGFSDELILVYVNSCRFPFNLSANAILRLKEAGVSSPVISAMLAHDGWPQSQNPTVPYTNIQQPQSALSDSVPSPPAPEEVIPVAPGPDYYWAPGYWGWNDGWVWIGGRWCIRGGGGLYGRGWYSHYGGGGFHGSFHGGGFHGGSGHSGYHGGGDGGYFSGRSGYHGHGGRSHGGGGGHGGGHGGGGHGR